VAVAALVALAAGCKSAPPKLPPLPPQSSLLLPPPPAAVAPPDQPIVDRVVALVNEDVVMMSELQEAIVLYLRDAKEPTPPPGPERDQLAQKVLTRMIDHRLQVQEARKERIEVTDEDIQPVMDDFIKRNGGDRERVGAQLKAQGLTWDQVRREMRESLLAQKIRSRRIGRRATVTEAEVEAYVTENRPKLERDLKYHPRHIAILAQPPDGQAGWDQAKTVVDTIQARLKDGGDFAELAREFSKDGSAESGGDLGWLHRGELAAGFEEPILRLEKGQVTEPIKSSLGYHLFRLDDREELTPEMVNTLRQQARDILVQKKMQDRFDEWVQGLRQRALIAERL
jgi:peptidyl-prolyl cis-trans isomerase SurA